MFSLTAVTDCCCLNRIESLLKALADETRLRMVALLAEGEICVCDIHASLGISQPKASRHLAYLRRSGIVRARRNGHWVHYRLAEPGDDTVRRLLAAVSAAAGTCEVLAVDRARLADQLAAAAARLPAACCVPRADE